MRIGYSCLMEAKRTWITTNTNTNESENKTNRCAQRMGGRRHTSVDVVCVSNSCAFGTTPLSATASKNRSTTALPCRRFDSEMCSFGKCA